jgi:hypothetical protein
VALAVVAACPMPLKGENFGIADAPAVTASLESSAHILFVAILPDISGDLVLAITLAVAVPIALRSMVARFLGYTWGSRPKLRDAKEPLLKPFLNFATCFSCLALLLFALCIWPKFEPGSVEASVLLWAAFCLTVGSAFYAWSARGREKTRLIEFSAVQKGKCESDDLEKIRTKLINLERSISFALTELSRKSHKHKHK